MSLHSLKKVGLAALVSVPLIFSGCSKSPPDYISYDSSTKQVTFLCDKAEGQTRFLSRDQIMGASRNLPFMCQMSYLKDSCAGAWEYYRPSGKAMYLKSLGAKASRTIKLGDKTPEFFVFMNHPSDGKQYSLNYSLTFFMDDDAAKISKNYTLEEACYDPDGQDSSLKSHELTFTKVFKGVYKSNPVSLKLPDYYYKALYLTLKAVVKSGESDEAIRLTTEPKEIAL